MRIQMSLEFVIYAAISLASLTGALAAYSAVMPKYSSMENGAELTTFASAVNANMQYASSTFDAFVPRGICNPVNEAWASTAFDSRVAFGAGLCNSAGGIRQVSMSMDGNGTVILMVEK